MRYPGSKLWEEMSFLAYHLHWSFESLLDMEHRDRHELISQIDSLNTRAWEEVRELAIQL